MEFDFLCLIKCINSKNIKFVVKIIMNFEGKILSLYNKLNKIKKKTKKKKILKKRNKKLKKKLIKKIEKKN